MSIGGRLVTEMLFALEKVDCDPLLYRVVSRYTFLSIYGDHVVESVADTAKATGMSVRQVNRIRKRLFESKVISMVRKQAPLYGRTSEIKLNDPSEWGRAFIARAGVSA